MRAGVVLGVEGVPDGLAAGLLAGVNPVFGLYAYLVGMISGALATSSVFMTVEVTGAMAVVVSDVPQTQDESTSGPALATLALLTGLVMLGLGLARLGSLARFVPNAVLVGFVNAVAVSIVLGQVDNLTGHDTGTGNRILRSLDALLNIASFDWASVGVGVSTIVLILLLERSRLGPLGLVVAVALTSLATWAIGLESVLLIDDVAEVPRHLPSPALPDLGLVAPLLIPALSLAFVGLVQGAAISSAVPNPDGEYPDASADFRGQGVANLAAAVLQAMPVGGSMSATALVRAAGARTALANLVAGLVMCLSIVAFGATIGYLAMPALAGLLILVGVRTFKAHDVAMVWRTGPTQAAVLSITFVLTMVIPLQYAVLVGVGLSVILYVARQSNKVVVRRWTFDDAGAMPVESDPPAVLAPGEVVVLAPYGSLFFAAAPVFEAQLPKVPTRSGGSVVIIRLRGKDELGSTFIKALARYAERLDAAGAALMLVGVGPRVLTQLEDTGVLDRIGRRRVFEARPRVGDSIAEALREAAAWSGTHRDSSE